MFFNQSSHGRALQTPLQKNGMKYMSPSARASSSREQQSAREQQSVHDSDEQYPCPYHLPDELVPLPHYPDKHTYPLARRS